MNYFKRYLTLRSQSGESSTVSVEVTGGSSEIKIIGKAAQKNGFLLLSDGFKTEKHAVNALIAADLDLSKDVYACLVIGGERYFGRVGSKFFSGEELIDEYEKLSLDKEKTAPQKAQVFQNYDDELIAEENYYLKESAGGKDPDDKDAQTEKGGQLDKEGAGGQPRAFEDESDRRPREEPYEGGRAEREPADEQRGKAFYERDRHEKQIGNIENLLASYPSEKPLTAIYPFGKFARVKSDDRSFIVGKIEYGGRIYYCVGTDGSKRRFLAENPEKSFFVPRSPFKKTDEGYLLSFFTEDMSDYITRRF